ncbi:MAG: 1,4-dihydroxy-2-naphthoate octaprenyltransferase, partial [archaeon]|nr:1,4-dihydroxy-2-naphthoate octaprenyltransferase [archaeon]
MADVKPVNAGWFNVFRPWTLHGAVVPVLIGGAVAYVDGVFCWWIFLMVVACGILLQSAANILNTYGDFVKGTDTVENETRSPELVTGVLTAKKVFMAGMACLGITALCGLVFIWYIGWGILVFGILGIAGAALYTVGLSYKYLGMGQIGVFFLMGVLMPLGTYYVMSGELSWTVFLLGLPNAFMITAVLSGNEMRDFHEDLRAGVGTLSSHLGYENGMKLYLVENLIGYPILALIIALGVAPWTCFLA